LITQSPAACEIKNKLRIQGSNLELEGEKRAVLRTAADIESILQVYNATGGIVRDITITGPFLTGTTPRLLTLFAVSSIFSMLKTST